MKTPKDLPIDFCKNGRKLITVVIQDVSTKEVLFPASTNRTAFLRTIESGEVWLYSRSRRKLWHKGETSKCILKVEEIRMNCEKNSLLYLVTCLGEGACHLRNEKGQYRKSCFFRRMQMKGDA
jgi:phosphoribosyl-AMP cyclohydrolase